MNNVQLNADAVSESERLSQFQSLLTSGRLTTLVQALPLLLSLRGKRYELKDHFPFEPLFSTQFPRNVVLNTGRQVSKSTSMAARSVLLAASIPYFKILFVTPLHEQILRFSNDYVRPFIEDSPIRTILRPSGTVGSVLRRAFVNRSVMYFSYAFTTAERIRGISADFLGIDEVQDIDPDHVPVISETLSASKYKITQYSGTSKTRDGLLEHLWQRSSQAEWVVRCSACNFDNYAMSSADGGHVERMIGPYRDDICEASPGVVCAKCGRPIQPRIGRWMHKFAERAGDTPGYHVPQIIMPMHYADKDMWKIILGKQAGVGNYTTARFYNEVLGIAYDVSTKLINKSDLEKAGCLHQNVEDEAAKLIDNYVHRIIAVDWGGGGDKGVSFTAVAIIGYRPDGKIDVIFGKRLLTPHAHLEEARECLRLFNRFKCHFLAHDYTGAGDLRHTFLVSNRLPNDAVLPIAYVLPARQAIMGYHQPSRHNPRGYYSVDKTRTLQKTCYAIKFGKIRFFEYDGKNPGQPGLMDDFLALIETSDDRPGTSSMYRIVRNPSMTDDFAQAVNIGCSALWHLHDAWPTFSDLEQAPASVPVMLDGQDQTPWQHPWSMGEVEAMDDYT